MADSLARELLSCPSETRPQVPDDPYPIDPDTVLAEAKAARRAALRNILPENPTPLPEKFTRAEATRLRRIVTETAVTPARRAMMRLQTWQSATCRSCPGNQLLDQNHILWGCSDLAEHRRRAIATLPPTLRPQDLDAWRLPTGPPERRRLIFQSLLQFLQESKMMNNI